MVCLAAAANLPVTLAPLFLCGSGARGGGQGRDGGLWLKGPSSFLVLVPHVEYVPEPCCVYPNMALRTSSNVKDQESKQERKASYYESNREEAPSMRIRECVCIQQS